MPPLPLPLLLPSTLLTLSTLLISTLSIHSHLRSYRQPHLQRHVVRIMLMVPLYAGSSLVSMMGGGGVGFFVDAVRDCYEAFVIYSFFHLLLAYLGGDRSLLIMLHGRPARAYLFPVSLFKRECDVSDPFVFLGIRRGIFQYVQIKPLLALATMILRATGTYHEGTFTPTDGYLYISIIYNTSICVSLYSLAMFWVVVHDDIKPFRPVPKFLCVKGILFFSFWQSILISILAASGLIPTFLSSSLPSDIALFLNDTLITFEMPLFAVAHFYAFSARDYSEGAGRLVARMPVAYAWRDAFGLRDVLADARATMRGAFSYRAYEPAEGGMHQGSARERRIRAGLRYAQGGRRKYWLPQTVVGGGVGGGVGKREEREGHAPLLGAQAAGVVHDDGEFPSSAAAAYYASAQEEEEWDRTSLEFRGPDEQEEEEEADEVLFAKARLLEFGDGNYPVVDCSDEVAKRWMRQVEEGIMAGRMSAVGRGVRERERLLSEPGAGYGGVGGVGGMGGGRAGRAGRAGLGEQGRTMSLDGAAAAGVKAKKEKGVKGKRASASGSGTPSASSSRSSHSGGGGVYGQWAEHVPPVPPPLSPAPAPAPSPSPAPDDDAAEPRKGVHVLDMAPAPLDLTIGPGLQLHLAHKKRGGGGERAGMLSPPVRASPHPHPPNTPPRLPPHPLPLPSDAVDLVRSSPSPSAVTPRSERTVYKQGLGHGAEARVELGEEEADVRVVRGDGGQAVGVGVQVVRAESPPPRVGVVVRSLEGENPWAD